MSTQDDRPYVEIPLPDDWHVHLRDGPMLDAVVGYTARRFRHAMVMPNLAGPITSVAAAAAYRQRILAAAAGAPHFDPWMTLYCSADIDLADLRAGLADGVVRAVKYYPAGATTNSDAGGSSMLDFLDLFEVVAEAGARLLVHAESTDPSVDLFDRESVFLDRELLPVRDRLPELAVTVEHLSTAAGLAFVAAHPNTAGTITPHHLSRDRGDLLGQGLKPDLYCKPVLNTPRDRVALVAAATTSKDVCLGTDSAPHPTTRKYAANGAAGVFNAAHGLEVTAEVFWRAGALDRLGAFLSSNGCAIYGVDSPTTSLRLTRTGGRDVEHLVTTADGDDVTCFGVEEAAAWAVESR